MSSRPNVVVRTAHLLLDGQGAHGAQAAASSASRRPTHGVKTAVVRLRLVYQSSYAAAAAQMAAAAAPEARAGLVVGTYTYVDLWYR